MDRLKSAMATSSSSKGKINTHQSEGQDPHGVQTAQVEGACAYSNSDADTSTGLMQAAAQFSAQLSSSSSSSSSFAAASLHDLNILRSIQRQLEHILSLKEIEKEPAKATVATSISKNSSHSMPPSAAASVSYLLALDEAVLKQTLSFCNTNDLVRLHGCNRYLQKVAISREVWEPICTRTWPWIKRSDLSSLTTAPLETAHYDFSRRRVQAQAMVQKGKKFRRYEEFDLAIDLRNMATGDVLYSVRGPIKEDFGVEVFSFQGFVLHPAIVANNESLLFEDAATAMAFFGEQGCLQLEFIVLDKTKQKVAELAILSRSVGNGNSTRASLGWNREGERMEEEMWVFCSSDAIFLERQIRLLRGITLTMEKVLQKHDDGRPDEEMVRCKVVSAWICDHQYLGDFENRPSPTDVLQIFDEMLWT